MPGMVQRHLPDDVARAVLDPSIVGPSILSFAYGYHERGRLFREHQGLRQHRFFTHAQDGSEPAVARLQDIQEAFDLRIVRGV